MGRAYDIWQVDTLIKKIYRYDVEKKGPAPTKEEREYVNGFIDIFRSRKNN